MNTKQTDVHTYKPHCLPAFCSTLQKPHCACPLIPETGLHGGFSSHSMRCHVCRRPGNPCASGAFCAASCCEEQAVRCTGCRFADDDRQALMEMLLARLNLADNLQSAVVCEPDGQCTPAAALLHCWQQLQLSTAHCDRCTEHAPCYKALSSLT